MKHHPNRGKKMKYHVVKTIIKDGYSVEIEVFASNDLNEASKEAAEWENVIKKENQKNCFIRIETFV